MMKINLLLFDTDLRVHDHEPLFHAMNQDLPVIALYAFPKNAFKVNAFGFQNIQPPRLRFIMESLIDLKSNLAALNVPLYVTKSEPHLWMKHLLKDHDIASMYYHQPLGSYEIKRIDTMKEHFPKITYQAYDGDTLYHIDDIGIHPSKIQKTFTLFRKHIEKNCQVRSCLPIPKPQPVLIDLSLDDDLSTFISSHDMKQPFFMKGGEKEALFRLHEYIFTTKHISHYKYTRNQMSHFNDSSKFSPYLAIGSLSPRLIYHDVKSYEALYGKSISTYWLIFELIWRDYFHFLHRKHQDQFFKLNGLFDSPFEVIHNDTLLQAWMEGKTGLPMVDANMRELKTWGWMSNRGRQNVASFLSKYLKQDWRIGARWFESLLIDYDVSSNWGNWQYNAGVGVDPREDRIFDVTKQAQHYDPKAEYLSQWIPELRSIPLEYRFIPFVLSEKQQEDYQFYLNIDYPKPIIDHPLIHRYMKHK